jgi:hypothetical protein
MFALSDANLQLRILGCADGPASINAESTQRRTAVVLIDPLYRFDTTRIRNRIAVTYDQMWNRVDVIVRKFVWDTIQSVEELGRIRMQAMQAFLNDYDWESAKAVTLMLNCHRSFSRTNHRQQKPRVYPDPTPAAQDSATQQKGPDFSEIETPGPFLCHENYS